MHINSTESLLLLFTTSLAYYQDTENSEEVLSFKVEPIRIKGV